MKRFDVEASTTSSGSATTAARAGRNKLSKYVNSTIDSTIDNEEKVVMIGRGGKTKITGLGIGFWLWLGSGTALCSFFLQNPMSIS